MIHILLAILLTAPPPPEFDIGWGLTSESIEWVEANYGPLDLEPIRFHRSFYSQNRVQ